MKGSPGKCQQRGESSVQVQEEGVGVKAVTGPKHKTTLLPYLLFFRRYTKVVVQREGWTWTSVYTPEMRTMITT